MMRTSLISLIALTLSSLGLSACGFSPVHAPSSFAQKAAFQDIAIEAVESGRPSDDQSAFFLTQRLRDRLGANGSKHILRITPRLSQRRLGVSGEDVASRYDFVLTTRYELLDSKSGDILDKGTIRSVSSFGSPTDAYGQQASETNATQTIAKDAADRLMLKLARYYTKPSP